MPFSFCWEVKNCDRPCPVRETETIFCWRSPDRLSTGTDDPCEICTYRLNWLNQEYSLKDFLGRCERRRSPRVSKKILVIDDEPNILYALEETVKAEGHACMSADDGREGLFLARQLQPDLIISDVIMPKINGYDLCRYIKNDGLTSHIPVILVTVKAADQDISEGSVAGADAYLVKPFHAHDLTEKIEQFISPA